MSKEIAIQATLKEMRVGEAIRFPMDKGDEYLEVERIFSGKEESWIVYENQKREVLNNVQDVARIIAAKWNPSLKRVMKRQFSELDDIEDLGEF